MLPLKCNRLSRFACSGVLGAAATLIACGGGSNGVGPLPVTLQSITVTSQNASVPAGLTQQFTATGNFSDGTTKPLATVNWSTSDAALATISPTGLLTTLKQGVATVSAASGAATGSISFNIGPPVPTGLVISPANSSVTIGAATPSKLSAILSFTDKRHQGHFRSGNMEQHKSFYRKYRCHRQRHSRAHRVYEDRCDQRNLLSSGRFYCVGRAPVSVCLDCRPAGIENHD